MKAQILKMLREADGYISGQQLCEKIWSIQDGSMESDPSAPGRRI